MDVKALFFACLCILGTFVRHGEANFVKRKTIYGRVRGFKTRFAQVYLGVPFATPPERWTAPIAPSRWRGTLDTLEAKPQCFQGNSCSSENPPFSCVRQESEDCLYLNIFTPKNARKNSKKPVMVFIHGGSFDASTPSALAYNGEMLAKKGDVIVVNIAYRLGAFGFLVTGASSNDITGNYGLMDQRLAMQWVKDNIKNFGGNPVKITLFGNSAGASSVAFHLTSGKADNLFQQAIIQSAPFGIPTKPLHVAVNQGLLFSIISNCNKSDTTVNTTCLRTLPASDIAAYMKDVRVITFSDSASRSIMPWFPHVDGDEIKQSIMKSLVNATFPGKTIIIGTVTQEASTYVRVLFKEPVAQAAIRIVVRSLVPNMTRDVLDMYGVPDPLDARDVLEEMATDYFFVCPTRQAARALSNLENVYMYSFNQTLNFDPILASLPQCVGKVCHSFEVPYVFQSGKEEPFVFTREERGLSDKIIAYWSTFAKYGNPNKGINNATVWPRFKTNGGNKDYLIRFQADYDNMPLLQGYRSRYCDALDALALF